MGDYSRLNVTHDRYGRVSPVKVGEITVTEPKDCTEHYECAAWHKTVRVEPGTYDVFTYPRWSDGALRPDGLYVQAHGKVVDACFVSRLGAHYGKDPGVEMVGQLDKAYWPLATYWRAGEAQVDLLPGFLQVEAYTHTPRVWDSGAHDFLEGQPEAWQRLDRFLTDGEVEVLAQERSDAQV